MRSCNATNAATQTDQQAAKKTLLEMWMKCKHVWNNTGATHWRRSRMTLPACRIVATSITVYMHKTTQ